MALRKIEDAAEMVKKDAYEDDIAVKGIMAARKGAQTVKGAITIFIAMFLALLSVPYILDVVSHIGDKPEQYLVVSSEVTPTEYTSYSSENNFKEEHLIKDVVHLKIKDSDGNIYNWEYDADDNTGKNPVYKVGEMTPPLWVENGEVKNYIDPTVLFGVLPMAAVAVFLFIYGIRIMSTDTNNEKYRRKLSKRVRRAREAAENIRHEKDNSDVTYKVINGKAWHEGDPLEGANNSNPAFLELGVPDDFHIEGGLYRWTGKNGMEASLNANPLLLAGTIVLVMIFIGIFGYLILTDNFLPKFVYIVMALLSFAVIVIGKEAINIAIWKSKLKKAGYDIPKY